MIQKFLQNFREKRNYMRERIQRLPFGAATPFEQTILNGSFEIMSIAVALLPIRWWIERLESNRKNLKSATALRLIQLTFLLLFIWSTWVAFMSWDLLVSNIRLFINHPNIAMEYTPNTIDYPMGLAWVSILLSIYIVGIAIITLRLKNVPLLLRVSTFCLTSGIAGSLNRVWDFRMPVAVWLSGRMLGVVLMGLGAFCLPLCAVWTKKWIEKYPGLFYELPTNKREL